MPFQVIESCGGKVEGVVSYTSVGLSDYELKSSTTGKIIHQELFLALAGLPSVNNIPALIQSIGNGAIHTNHPFVRGQIIGPQAGQVIRGTRFSALYVAMPAYWPDSFSSCKLVDRTVVFAWLVPITFAEAKFVHMKGWNVFENALTEWNLDMCDINRAELAIAD